ncbi:uncharacterized protein NMK_2484 [Novimethylophilus kurashikiensis]|uniref:Uncharacterized protein n=1 Tax=Novimethylophilus kurashikiensis TaxID=1825523 RepID=A0A2R5FDD1_9PROT|nr:hypothetical protein [Novimethylophilus kurashikiensis]GBG14883.1 uncharacterized protein NMK_2484 [Novimethylophilus kurashikiensis]
MKNTHQESLLDSSRKAAKSSAANPLLEGVVVSTHYSDGSELSFCDAIKMKLGAQWVRIHWEHPRKVWLDRTEALAYDMALDEFPNHSSDFEVRPIHTKVGRSRKKVSRWQVVGEPEDGFYPRFLELQKVCLEAANFEILPSLHVTQHDDGRWVTIVCPVEIRTPDEALSFAHLVRRFLLQPGLFEATFAGYAYDRVTFDREREFIVKAGFDDVKQ